MQEQIDISSKIASARNYLMAMAINRKYVFNHEDAEDLVQETILRACAKKDLYQPTCKVETWMATIMYRIMIDEYRKNNRNRNKTGFGVKNVPLSKNEYLISSSETACSSLHQQEIINLLNVLTVTERRIIQMKVDGYENEEISETLNLGYGAVRSHIFRARLKMMNSADFEVIKERKNGHVVSKKIN